MITFVLNTIKTNLRLDIKKSFQAIVTPSFFIFSSALYPLTIGTDTQLLQSIGAGIICVGALLSSLLPLNRIYRDDLQDGTFDLLHFSPQPIALYCLGKIIAHWLICGLPLLIAAPFIALSYHLDISLTTLLLTLTPLTMLLVLIGQLCAALSGNNGQSASLTALLALPLYIPPLIFAAAALGMEQGGLTQNTLSPLLFLWAGLSITLPITPIVTAAILKMQQS